MQRKSTFFLCVFLAEAAVLGLLVAHATFNSATRSAGIEEKTAMVERLGLTDLCLFPEARYTRHLTQADVNSAFQDHPLSLEHFPSGSFTQPPERLWLNHERVD